MSRFFLFFILGTIFLLLGFGFFNFINNGWLNIPAAINNALQNLISQFFSPKNNFIEAPLVKKETNPETSKEGEVPAPENYEKDSIPVVTNPTLAEIAEKLDDISEKIDVIMEESDKLFQEKKEKDDKEQISEEKEVKEQEKTEKIKEKEEEKEKLEKPEEAKIEEKEIVYCQKGEGNPARNKLIFNEISWMGSNLDWRNEWLEIKNVSGDSVSLKNWQILDKDQEIKMVFEEKDKISPSQLFLLERTNDDSVPNVLADKIYSGNLNDENEILYLFDENCQLQDEVLANPNWPAGDKTERRSMERNEDLDWHTYSGGGENGILGTPKEENSQQLVFGGASGGAVAPPEVTNLPKILISEVFFDAEGSDENQEFIELFNPNETEADLSDWSIQYLSSNSASIDKIEKKNFGDGNKIEAQNYFLLGLNGKDGDLKWSQSLGNTGGTIILVDNKEKITDINDINIVDRIGYGTGEGLILAEGTAKSLENFEAGKSLARKWDEEKEEYQDTDDNNNDFEVQDSTPKMQNQNPTTQVPVVEDNVPPEVAFNQISSLQTSLSFSLDWVGQDFALEGTTPSGIDGFYLEYNVTPSDIDGIAFQYQDVNNSWQEWKIGQILEIEENQNSIDLLGKDNKVYNIQIKAKDKAGNESDWVDNIIEINTLPVVINEIAWMGTETSFNNEWIEIFNNTGQDINLAGWTLKAADGTPEINLEGLILGKNYYLLERTDDNTLPDILADQIYTGALGNSGEDFKIFDNSGKLIDSVAICEKGWCAGDNTTKQTMERINPLFPGSDSGNWASSLNPGGTPKNQNSQFFQ